MFLSTQSRVFLMALGLHLITGFSARAEEKHFPEFDCAVTPPDGWEMSPNTDRSRGVIAVFTKPDKTKLALLLADSANPPEAPLDEAFIADFNKGVEESGGGKLVSGRFTEIAGIKAYERLGEAMIDGTKTSLLLRTVPANGRFYTIQGMSVAGPADKDADLIAFLDSFRFLSPPEAPRKSPEAYKLGYMLGKYAGVAAIPALIVVAVVLVILAIRAMRGTRWRRH